MLTIFSFPIMKIEFEEYEKKVISNRGDGCCGTRLGIVLIKQKNIK